MDSKLYKKIEEEYPEIINVLRILSLSWSGLFQEDINLIYNMNHIIETKHCIHLDIDKWKKFLNLHVFKKDDEDPLQNIGNNEKHMDSLMDFKFIDQ